VVSTGAVVEPVETTGTTKIDESLGAAIRAEDL